MREDSKKLVPYINEALKIACEKEGIEDMFAVFIALQSMSMACAEAIGIEPKRMKENLMDLAVEYERRHESGE